jgi:hypothetical protein
VQKVFVFQHQFFFLFLHELFEAVLVLFGVDEFAFGVKVKGFLQIAGVKVESFDA